MHWQVSGMTRRCWREILPDCKSLARPKTTSSDRGVGTARHWSNGRSVLRNGDVRLLRGRMGAWVRPVRRPLSQAVHACTQQRHWLGCACPVHARPTYADGPRMFDGPCTVHAASHSVCSGRNPSSLFCRATSSSIFGLSSLRSGACGNASSRVGTQLPAQQDPCQSPDLRALWLCAHAAHPACTRSPLSPIAPHSPHTTHTPPVGSGY